MLYYNNPEAIQAVHEGIRERRIAERRRRFLRLVASSDHSEA